MLQDATRCKMPTDKQILQIAAEALMDTRTVKKVYAGGDIRRLSHARVEEAAKKLKIPAPPERRK